MASPHVTFRMTEPRFVLDGRASELFTEMEAVTQELDRFHRLSADATGRPQQAVVDDLRRGRVLDADVAIDMGLVHEIVRRSSS